MCSYLGMWIFYGYKNVQYTACVLHPTNCLAGAQPPPKATSQADGSPLIAYAFHAIAIVTSATCSGHQCRASTFTPRALTCRIPLSRQTASKSRQVILLAVKPPHAVRPILPTTIALVESTDTKTPMLVLASHARLRREAISCGACTHEPVDSLGTSVGWLHALKPRLLRLHPSLFTQQ